MDLGSGDYYEDDFSVESNGLNQEKEKFGHKTALHLENPPDSPCELSKRLVVQGEKYIKVGQDLNKAKDEVKRLQNDLDSFREFLIKDLCRLGTVDNEKLIADPSSAKYSNVPLENLLRLRLQYHSNYIQDRGDAQGANGDSFFLTEELSKSNKQIKELQKQYIDLKGKYEATFTEKSEIEKLKKKVIHLVERSRYEREVRSKAESDVQLHKTKLDALSDHIERLMVYLKHEATAKVSIVKDKLRAQREVELLHARDKVLSKKVACKDRLIEDLKGSASILENQLHLMDEKYMELRLKLDWSRSYSERALKQKDNEIKELNDEITLLKSKISKAKMVSYHKIDFPY